MIRLIFSIIILFIVFIPSLRKAKGLLYAKEKDTLVLVKYLEKNSNKNDYIMSDYGELNFYAKRKTTLKMASLSKSAIQCGGITSDKLIKELNYYPVKFVVIHKEGEIASNLVPFFNSTFAPHHLITLIESAEGVKFVHYLNSNYKLINIFNRQGQIPQLYKSCYSDDDILEFVRNHSVFAVTIPANRAKTNLPLKLNSMGVFVYAHTVNDEKLMNELGFNGVNGFYTDELEP